MITEQAPADTSERAIIGALLTDRDAIASVADRLTPEAFANPLMRTIYSAVLRCWERRIPPDIVTVHAALQGMEYGATVQASDLSAQMLYVWDHGHPCHAAHYAELIVQAARKRAITEAGAKLMHLPEGTDPAVFLAEATASLDAFGAAEENQGPRSYTDLMPEFQERMIRIRSGELKHHRTPTGWRFTDRKLSGGFQPGELVILAARPGMGKSAYALNLAHNVAKQGQHTIVFSGEMTAESLLRRAVAGAGSIPGGAVFSDEMTEEQFDRFLLTSEQLTTLPVSIDETSGITTAQMLVRVQALQRRHNLGLVIFDYIELAGDQTGRGQENEERRINAITKRLKHIAVTCKVPVLALAQLNRQVESRSDKRPMLADLRHSGSIEQDADKVLFLYRPAYYAQMRNEEPGKDEEHLCEVIIAKQRNGENGTIRMYFEEKFMRFHEMSNDTMRRIA